MRPVLPALFALGLTLAASAASGQIETLELSPGFAPDPLLRNGVAGGPVAAETLGSGPMGACVGWVAATPSFEMELSAPFDSLEVAVTSAGDTTLVVQGPVGMWCNDDSNGLNPALFGRWAQGHYRVWVGTYAAGQTPTYSVALSGNREEVVVPPPAPTPAAPPAPIGVLVPPPAPTVASPPGLDVHATAATHGALGLSPGFLPDPQVFSGTSGGNLRADVLGATATGPCRGWIGSAPAYLLTVDSPFGFLRIDVASSGDTTLVVLGPNGWRCSDDSVGLDPRITGSFPAGVYRIWVGSYATGQMHPYQLTFSEYQ